jgi:hypothetical protein
MVNLGCGSVLQSGSSYVPHIDTKGQLGVPKPANGFEDPCGRVEFGTGPERPLTQRSTNRLGVRRIVFRGCRYVTSDRQVATRMPGNGLVVACQRSTHCS